MTIEIKIGRGVQISNTPSVVGLKIESDLTFENPEYKKALERGSYISSNISPTIVLYDKKGKTYWIPRGCIYYIIKFIRRIKHPYKIIDTTLMLSDDCFKAITFHGELRDYQKEGVSKMLQYPVGILEANTGSGKTTMGIAIIEKRKQNTLIVVHSRELLYQWKERIQQFLNVECGLVGDGKFNVKPITVGTIQTVKKRVDELTDKFGQLIIDEVHKSGTAQWSYTIQDFPAKYYLGLTATPFRSDKLGKIIFASVGPKIHKVNKLKLFQSKSVLLPDVFRIETSFRYTFTNDYAAMIKELTKDKSRNRLICSKIADDLKKHNELILIVSDRKEHLNIMQKTLHDLHGIESVQLTGASKKKDRTNVVLDLQNGNAKVVFATLSLIMEGFDLPKLTALFITTPIKFAGRIIQVCGRVLRPEKNKIPRIYDFRDNMVNVLKYSGYNRDRVYKSEWSTKK